MFSTPKKKGRTVITGETKDQLHDRLYRTHTAATQAKRIDHDSMLLTYTGGGVRLNEYGFPVSPMRPDLPPIRGRNSPRRSSPSRPKTPTRPRLPPHQRRPPTPSRTPTKSPKAKKHVSPIKNTKPRPKPAVAAPELIKFPPNAMKLFDSADVNGNGTLSLAEIDKLVVETFPKVNQKAALMRSYKSADKNNDGYIRRNEWPAFVQFVVYYNNLWAVFNYADVDSDKRITVDELEAANLNLPEGMTAAQVFEEMDTNKGGYVLFEEACLWIAKRKREVPKDQEQSVAAQDVLGDLIEATDKIQPPEVSPMSMDDLVLSGRARVTSPAAVPDPGEEKAEIPPSHESVSTAGTGIILACKSDEVPSKEKLKELWNRLDANGNGMLSLAELDKGVMEVYPKWNDKPALMRAYMAADQNGDGFVRKSEFRYFFALLQSYHELWKLFDKLDGGEDSAEAADDRRLTLEELQNGWEHLVESPLIPTTTSPEEIFSGMDTNKGGHVLFDEFCQYVAKEYTKNK